MIKLTDIRKIWEGKSDKWLYERLSNELTDKIDEIHKLLEQIEKVKNNVDLAIVSKRRELLIAYEKAREITVLLGDTTEEKVDEVISNL